MENAFLDKELEARAKRICKLRYITGLCRNEFAKRFSFDIDRVKIWEEPNSSYISEQEAQQLTKALQEEGIYCSEEWILEGAGSAPQIRMIF